MRGSIKTVNLKTYTVVEKITRNDITMTIDNLVSEIENNKILKLERIFDAPRHLLFQMFKEPQ